MKCLPGLYKLVVDICRSHPKNMSFKFSPNMAVQPRTLVILGVILILSTFLFENTDGFRLCGRRLSDTVNFICEKYGGFHAPRVTREVLNKSVGKRALIEVLHPLSRRTDPDAANEDNIDAEIPFSYQSGIVDECCKKQCTLTTLVSYCANVQGNVNLDEILPPGSENLPAISEEELAAYQAQQAPSPLDSSNGHLLPLPSHVAYASRPNLGLSARNRPVFTVLSQLPEDEDRALGEYRF